MASTGINGETTTIPHSNPPAAKVPKRNPLPCYVILVHGVNDVGEAYAPQEKGLCWGLAERLDRNHDLQPFEYVQPSQRRDDKLVGDPDKIYYRRVPNLDSYSPVIPFYWGFREEDGLIKNEKDYNAATHRQWLDRCNNRIDKDGAKNGGAFVNASNCLPHMWADGWEPDLKVKLLNQVAPSPTHDLKRAPYRSYQVLAALRLAMVIRIIRAHQPEAAINLVAHSMGCLVALLAQAYLMEDGEAPADTLVMNNPPYSFDENSLDAGLFKDLNQTSRARVETLKKIVKAFHENRARNPAWDDLKNPTVGKGLASRKWSPSQGTKKGNQAGQDMAFPERDNRGRTYLYFSPEDTTVALFNTQGIGWQGVPDRYWASWTVQGGPRPQTAIVKWNTLMNDLEASAFRQRIFLAQQRAGALFKVGLPPQHVSIRERGDTNGSMWAAVKRTFSARETPDIGTIRRINAEQLHPPIVFNPGPDLLPVSPIDAAIALAHGGSRDIEDIIDDPRPMVERVPLWPDPTLPPDWQPLEEILNSGKPPEQQFQRIRYAREILDEQNHPTGRILVRRDETPDETRLRWQSREMDENSHHSSIVSNHWHSQAVTAYDLALGRPIPWTGMEKKFYDYICEVADWRIKTRGPKPRIGDKLDPLKATGFYEAEDPKNKKLIEATAWYYVKGKLPPQVMAARTADKLSLIHFETTGKRAPAAG